jgi:outer membrane phospholipase A
MIYKIYNEDDTNKDIVKHLGFWELTILFSDLIVFAHSSLSLEFRTYAGSKTFDFDQGATELGLNFTFWSDNFNPSIYFQRFEGYSESLMNYDKRKTEYRLGLSLTF